MNDLIARHYKTLILFAALMFFLFDNAPGRADIATGLVGWWKFDEATAGACTTSVLDSSGNANTAACHASPTWIKGKIGSGAMNFASASDQYVESTTSTNIPKINASQTLSAWVNLPSTAASQDIVDPELNGTSANQLRVNGGDVQVSQWGGTVTITGGAVSANTWHMLTWTYNGGTNASTIYIDGAQSATSSTTAAQNSTPTAVYIGTYGTGEYFNGTIDDVRIYNRVLALADIQQLFDYYTGKNGLFTLMDN